MQATPNKSKSKKIKKLLSFLPILLIGILVFIAYITIRNSQISNTVDTSSSTPTTSSSSDTIVDNKPKNQDSTPTPVDNSIGITVSAAAQDNAGGPVLIRTILENASSGECSYSLTRGDTTKSYSSTVVFSGTYYSCNYDIPFNDLTMGTWNLNIDINMGNKSGHFNGSITIKA